MTGAEIALISLAAASAGTGIASAAGAFTKDPGKPPGRGDAAKAADSEQRRRAMARGQASTILGGSGGPQGSVGTKTLLGS